MYFLKFIFHHFFSPESAPYFRMSAQCRDLRHAMFNMNLMVFPEDPEYSLHLHYLREHNFGKCLKVTDHMIFEITTALSTAL